MNEPASGFALRQNDRPFADRAEAGVCLEAALPAFDVDETIVVALPRGGVPVAAEVCRARGLPLEVLIVRKVGAPGQSELALGAIVDGPEPRVVINDDVARALGLTRSEVMKLAARELPEVARRRKLYCGDRPRPQLKDKVVIVVDDGIATSASMKAALLALAEVGVKRIVLAVPVAPPDALAELSKLVDETYCLRTPEPFYAVGFYYRDFNPVSDDEVIAILG